jgi:hypothetical protein
MVHPNPMTAASAFDRPTAAFLLYRPTAAFCF